MRKVLHLTTHLNPGGITIYVLRLMEPLRIHGFRSTVASAGGEYEYFFEEDGAEVFRVDLKTKNEFHPKLLAAVPPLVRLIKRERFNLIHAHTRVSQVLAWMLQKITHLPVVTTCHGFYRNRLSRRWLPAWGDRVIAISPPVAEHLHQDFGVSKDRIRMVYNAVDLTDLEIHYRAHLKESSPKSLFGFSNSDIVIGIVARLIEEKGHEDLIRSFAELVRTWPHLRLLIVGEGRERGKLEALCYTLGVGREVHFSGNLTDVTGALAATDIFAFPAVWREAFGISVVEAMACSKPIVLTENCALADIIESSNSGIKVDAKNTLSLTNALRYLLEHPDICRTMGENAAKLAREEFSMERMSREIADVYNELLTRPKC